ncbi:Gfo/Idh/MocA family oxidoreductase [Hyphobacterium sp. HN65]|uniref:Gfo/Idh/MocA family oxidoreductase n=1 Tax=Hyphobacterium lacteum TaxID=3116575 RepID=A0ABU7LSH3_9PROT|nr:Gfo/Idh/MocA family oxidoreductase [Hyphobacterium sp. HN65]MEE2526851.1 Gfo/Idh/MocA family oxidoreductase [Hyphobacterium sp. HN65]
MEQVKWGILGAGKIARQFASDIHHAPGACLHSVGARDAGRAKAFAGEFGVPVAHGSYEGLVSDPEVDAIYVATPHSFHLEHSLQAIRAGKAVLCEKPLTATPGESEALVSAARDADVYLMEALWTAFLPAIRKARDWIDEGRIGEVLQIQADFGFRAPFDPDSRLWNPDLAGGAMLDIGIYPIAFNRLMTGRGPGQVSSVVRKAPTGVDAEVSAILRTETVTSVLSCSFLCDLVNTGRVLGSEGMIELPDFWRSGEAHLFRHGKQAEVFHDQRQGGGFEFEIEAASRDILAGRKESETVPHALSLALQDDMQRVMNAAA